MIQTSSLESICRWHDPKFQSRVWSVTEAGKVVFEQTSIVMPGDVADSDLSSAKRFFRVTTPDPNDYPNLANYHSRGGLVEHSDFSAEIAFRLASEVNKKIPKARLNAHANATALQLHDLGRTTTHSFMETDIMTEHLWSMIGIRADLHDLTHSAHLYWDDVARPPTDLSISEKISVIADTAGKRSSVDPARLRKVDEIIPSVIDGKKKYLNKNNLTIYERELVERLPEYTRRETAVISYVIGWFGILGINLDSIIQAIPVGSIA